MSKPPISYTGRDFESIKRSLVNYTKRYYANSYKDFNEASFGALMLDLVSYVGDQLSFYTDYQANESFLDSAMEIENVSRIAKQMGFKAQGAPSSAGACDFFVMVPASTTTSGPNSSYIPILKQGSVVSADGGAVFTLIEDVDFTNAKNEITVARVDSDTGVPTWFAIKATGTIISGLQYEEDIEVGDYQRFLRLEMAASNVTEILSIEDTQGKDYYKVDFLTQDVVVSMKPNRGDNRDLVPYIMKVTPAPRRFVTEYDAAGRVSLQFGYGSSDNLTTNLVADPADVTLEMSGRKYISDTTFDPSNLIKTDKFGIIPENTTLTVRYRGNSSTTINAAVGAVNSVDGAEMTFRNRPSLNASDVSEVIGSLEAGNSEPILGNTEALTASEIKTRAYASFASQNRAVTREDYMSLAYRMPSSFGRIKRVNIVQDPRSTTRNLNMYILAEGINGEFAAATTQLKNKLKVWLGRYKMMNDTVDILDGKIINYGIEFEVVADSGTNKYEVLRACSDRLSENFLAVSKIMGEPIHLTEIYKMLNDVPGVVDTASVKLTSKTGGSYSDYHFDMIENLSEDGRYLVVPQNAVADVRFPSQDIQGVIR